MTTKRVMLGDAEIAYDATGDGPAGIVLVPGWGCSRDNFADMLPILGAAGWHAVAMDTAGFFDSTASRESFSLEAAADDLVALVDHLRLTTVALVGHSFGGAVALEAAHRVTHADVLHVVGIDSLHYLTTYPKQDDASIDATLAPILQDQQAAIEATVHRYWPVKANLDLLEDSIRQMSSSRQASGIPLRRSLLAWDMDAALAKAPCPVTVLASAALVEQQAVARYGERMNIVPADLGGHFFLRQQPQATAALVLRALRHTSD